MPALSILALGLSTLLPLSRPVATEGTAPSAEVLFQDGVRLLQSGNVAEACPVLRESYGLDPALGALAVLALCHEQEGKLQTAFDEYLRVSRQAEAEGFAEKAKLALVQAQRIGPMIPRVELLTGDLPEGARVRIGQRRLLSAELLSAIPLDAGVYTVTIEAPGYAPETARFETKNSAPLQQILFAKLQKVSLSEESETTAMHWSEPVSAGLGVLGGSATVVGGIFGALALRNKKLSESECSSDACRVRGVERNDAARQQARFSTLFVSAGVGTLAGAGLIRWFYGSPSPVEVEVGMAGPVSVGLKGEF